MWNPWLNWSVALLNIGSVRWSDQITKYRNIPSPALAKIAWMRPDLKRSRARKARLATTTTNQSTRVPFGKMTCRPNQTARLSTPPPTAAVALHDVEHLLPAASADVASERGSDDDGRKRRVEKENGHEGEAGQRPHHMTAFFSASGPGSSMQKLRACRNRSSPIQRFFSTSSECMMAICPVGPRS